jgi:hypothetical protein
MTVRRLASLPKHDNNDGTTESKWLRVTPCLTELTADSSTSSERATGSKAS